MRRTRLAALSAVLATALSSAGCNGSRTQEDAASPGESAAAAAGAMPLRLYTVNYPLAYFAERIGGDRVEVEFPAPDGVDPAFWSPEAETVAAFQQAELILLNGAGYADWVDRVSLPSSRFVVTTQGVSDRLVTVDDAVTHTHGPEGEHAHGTVAFTTWLDPTIAIEQGRAIRDAFVRARPEQQGAFDEGFGALEADLEELDLRIAEVVSSDPARPLLASHPVYQYLAARYGLNLRSVHFEPDEPPAASAWRILREILAEHPAGWMLWEAEPLPETAARLRELGVESLVFAPSGNRPAEGDYLGVMRANAGNLAAVFAKD